MTPSTFEQFIRFGTDAAAIERMLRMVQSVIMVVASHPLLLDGFSQLIMLGNQHLWTDPRAAGVVVLYELQGHLGLARRFFRMFRFLECFYSAHQLYTSLYSQPPAPSPTSAVTPSHHINTAAYAKIGGQQAEPAAQLARAAGTAAEGPHQHQPQCRHSRQVGAPAEAWLDIFGRTFNGMYLLLETLSLVDALQIPAFSLWGPRWFSILFVEGQRFWFLGLLCGATSGLTKMLKLLTYAPVPPAGEGYGTGQTKDESELADWEKERERLRKIMWARREQKKIWKANIRSRSKGLVRKFVADMLDMILPGSIVGWWKVDQGTVGFILIITTYLTGWEVWERCGRELESQ